MAGKIKKRRNSADKKLHRISLSSLPISKPDFRKLEGTKDEIIKNWLKAWINKNLTNNKIQPGQLLPIKAELAYYFGVGEGTVQNAVRRLEDEGVVVSKQRIGTMIAGGSETNSVNKLTSKRDKIAEQIKGFIYENEMKPGAILPTAFELSEMLDSKRNTVRAALELLGTIGFIKCETNDDNQRIWSVVKSVNAEDITVQPGEIAEADTLAQKISLDIEEYITKNCKIGDRLDPINVWAKRFSVSDKTAYDALQMLLSRGVLQTRRGRYGTIVVKMPHDSAFQPAKETTIFMPAAEAAVYSYKRIEDFLRNKIREEGVVGEKMPSMKQLSEQLDVSTNTIRRAIQVLAHEGYVKLACGRFGGIYIVDIPDEQPQSFRWLAVNPQYVKSYKN